MPDADAEAIARAEAEPIGLGVLDAVDVGGTWTVVRDGEAAPAPSKPTRPRPGRRLLWAGAAGVALLLVAAVLAGRALPGPRQASAPPAAPSATGQTGAGPTPAPTAAAARPPGASVPAAQPQPTSVTSPSPVPSPSSSRAPSPTSTPSPAPTATATPTPIGATPTEVPPSPLPTGR